VFIVAAKRTNEYFFFITQCYIADVTVSISGEKRYVYSAWFEDPLGRPRRRWEDHCSVHKITPTHLTPNRISEVHTFISHFCETFLDIIHPSESRSLHFFITLYEFCTYPSPVHLNNKYICIQSQLK